MVKIFYYLAPQQETYKMGKSLVKTTPLSSGDTIRCSQEYYYDSDSAAGAYKLNKDCNEKILYTTNAVLINYTFSFI